MNNNKFNFLLHWFNLKTLIDRCSKENPDIDFNEIYRYNTVIKIEIDDKNLYFKIIFSKTSKNFVIITLYPDRNGEDKN